MSKSIVGRAADNIRILSAAMVEKARSGHPGGAMGGADFINILFSEFLEFDPGDPHWPMRDRFFLDPGHMSPMLYSILMLTGQYSLQDLQQFRQWGSTTPGHPELDLARGIENTSGPLGQGHVMAVGAAIAERFMAARFGEVVSHKTFAYLSDGSIQEEISQGAGRLAGFLGLSNLIMFFDSNDIQLSTETRAVTHENTFMKYEAWGWHVQQVNGHDEAAIRAAMKNAIAEKSRPSLIIGKTIMGYGSLDADGKSMEGLISTHGQPLSNAGVSFEKTVSGLGGDPADPFTVFNDVREYYREAMQHKARNAGVRKNSFCQWRKNNPVLSEKWELFHSGDCSPIDIDKVARKPNAATRNASGSVLSYLSEVLDNMIVMSADLSNSDKTEGFLRHTKPFTTGDFTGAFLHAGVSELTMAAIANGIALHGGLHVACGTFFVFSDYMKPAMRLSALMQLPVKYIFTHDSFRVGEDGPTHQPVEQEAQIRLLERLKNHSGRNSMLVLRPADVEETMEAWKMAMENRQTPTALILSRQDIHDLPAPAGSDRKQESLKAGKGAYVVMDMDEDPDVLLIASGSEVSTLAAAALLLDQDNGLKARLVSVISEGLFRSQDQSYQDAVIPGNIPVFGLTAGLPVTLQGLAGASGMVFGLDHFGYSAPYKVLDEKFGFTPDNIRNEILRFLGK